MRTFLKWVLFTVLFLSCAFLLYEGYTWFRMRNAYKTECTITFIGLPDGAVFGDFVDADGILHENEALYIDEDFQGHSAKVEQHYGKTITILYDKESGIAVNYDHTVSSTLMSAALIAVCILLLRIMHGKQKKTASAQQTEAAA